MKTILLFITLLSVTSANADPSYFYASAGIGKNAGNYWVGEDDLGALLRFGYTNRVSERYNIWFDMNITHLSQYNLGVPFNNKPENFIDHVGIGFEIRWGE